MKLSLFVCLFVSINFLPFEFSSPTTRALKTARSRETLFTHSSYTYFTCETSAQVSQLHYIQRSPCASWIVLRFFSLLTQLLRSQSNVRIKMIESVNLPSIHTSGQFSKHSDGRISDNYRLKFPFLIKQVDPSVNQSLLKDFTGIALFVFLSLFISRINKWIKLECLSILPPQKIFILKGKKYI